MNRFFTLFLLFICFSKSVSAQVIIHGKTLDDKTSETLIGANILIKGTTNEGVLSDYDGEFELKTSRTLPLTLVISYIGYTTKEVIVTNAKERVILRLVEENFIMSEVEIKGQRISDKQKESPLTVESLDALAIKQAASNNFYDALGSQKGVDLTTASLGFTIINTRGFNSTSPVRSLQIIDGVDNQSPGLNFSLGNFLGASELDVNKVDLIVGASSAFYGPNAFNGVISMKTKNPFYNKGLSVSLKGGERNLFEGAIRYANTVKNKTGNDFMAYKFNFSYMRAYDWEADNYDPITDSEVNKTNPGGFDAVNIYGDEYSPTFDQSTAPLFSPYVGLGQYHRTGYKEKDLVDYNTKNLKTSAAVHFRLKPSLKDDSPELIYNFNLGNGTTVYQGDNRFSLRDIVFFQNRLEFRKKDKFFIRAYNTQEDAGRSFDPYFTSLLLLERNKSNEAWNNDYVYYWRTNYGKKKMNELGYPKDVFNPSTFMVEIDKDKANQWIKDNQPLLTEWHKLSRIYADTVTVAPSQSKGIGFLEPGTARFKEVFDEITLRKSNKRLVASEAGTRFFDRSALYHVQGEYKFNPSWTDEITVGGSFRQYRPNSEGTIFYDTAGRKILNTEYGIYAGIEKKLMNNRIKTNATLRMDKNLNFPYLFSPAASIVYQPDKTNYFRLSFSSAIRNPTLTDQYLFLNVGRAILAGNVNGVDNLITIKSFRDYLDSNFDKKQLSYFNIPAIKPEKVKSLEVGYRTTLFEKVFVDASYYFSVYDDFLGFNIGVKSNFDQVTGFPIGVQAYRYAANSTNRVTTQGFSAGANYYFKKYYMLSGNYSWNKLNKELVDDPIIPAFNTPRHKFNISISGRDMGKNNNKFGFLVNYKWIEGFTFEGSPQFTGFIPTYDLLDAQVNYRVPKINTTFKLGASNVLNKLQFQTYGGPRIGRLAYFTVIYDFVKI
ncbi:MAG: TonB-dependent receptor [Saprospiraceae bacterium]